MKKYLAGRCSMGSTSAREQEQTMEGGWLGQESSPTKKLSLFFLLPLSTALNGSNSNHYTFFCRFNFPPN